MKVSGVLNGSYRMELMDRTVSYLRDTRAGTRVERSGVYGERTLSLTNRGSESLRAFKEGSSTGIFRPFS